MDIASKLKELRYILGMNQLEFTEFLDIKQSTLSAYERDISNPSLDVLLKISQRCNVSLDWLCGSESKNKFITGADIIEAVLEMQNIFNANILFEQMDGVNNGQGEGTDPALEDNIFSFKELNSFLEEYRQMSEKMQQSQYEDIREEYVSMWLEKKIRHYEKYRIDCNKSR